MTASSNAHRQPVGIAAALASTVAWGESGVIAKAIDMGDLAASADEEPVPG